MKEATMRCDYCDGSGRYASSLTNWDSVPCYRCNGAGVLRIPGWTPKSDPRPMRIEEPAQKMRAQLDALKGVTA